MRDAGVDVVVLVGLLPGRGLHGGLALHRAGLHGGVDLVAGAVQESGVDERQAVGDRHDAGVEVDGGAALLVHDPDLEGETLQAEQVLDGGEEVIGEGDLLRAVLLRLDDVDRAGAGVAQRVVSLHGRQRAEGGEDGVHDALVDLLAVDHDGGVGHEVADVAAQQQGAAVQADGGAVGAGELEVLVEAAGESLAALVHLGGQLAGAQAVPVGVAQGLVGGVDGGDGVLEVDDGRGRGLETDVVDARGVVLADRARAVDVDDRVQAVVAQQERGGVLALALPATEALRVGQGDHVAVDDRGQPTVGDDVVSDVGVGTLGERGDLVEKRAGPGDDSTTADRVVSLAGFAAVGVRDDVGSVEGVVQRAPAGVGGIECVAAVEDGDDELRAGDAGDLFVDVGGADRLVGGTLDEVADGAQELLELGRIRLARVGAMVVVELALQLLAAGEELAVARGELSDDVGQSLPQALRGNPGTSAENVGGVVMQGVGDVEAGDVDVSGGRGGQGVLLGSRVAGVVSATL